MPQPIGPWKFIHSAIISRMVPEPAKKIYRRGRDWILRRRHDPHRFWSEWGKTYIKDFPPTGERKESVILEALSELEFSSLLDVGCGYGRYLKVIKEALSPEKLCGADISDTQIEEAHRFLAKYPEIKLQQSPATTLPFADASFDVVLTYGLMVCLRPEEVTEFLREARRVSRRWGVFLESSNNPDKPHLNPHYYFAHEYEGLFAELDMPVRATTDVDPTTREKLYVVELKRSND